MYMLVHFFSVMYNKTKLLTKLTLPYGEDKLDIGIKIPAPLFIIIFLSLSTLMSQMHMPKISVFSEVLNTILLYEEWRLARKITLKNYIMSDEVFMRAALKQAQKAYEKGEVPVGAVVVKDGKIIAKAHNKRETKKNAVNHAELLAIKKACKKLGGWRLWQCELYVTLEPCPMCAGAIINSRLRRVVYGAKDKKAGCCESVINLFELPFNHKPEVCNGVLQEECTQILQCFFKDLREKKKWGKKRNV